MRKYRIRPLSPLWWMKGVGYGLLTFAGIGCWVLIFAVGATF